MLCTATFAGAVSRFRVVEKRFVKREIRRVGSLVVRCGMGEPDSWEDMEEGGAPPRSATAPSTTALKLNANAPSFTFNPSATSFTPFHAAPPAAQAPTMTTTPAAAPLVATHGGPENPGPALNPPVQAGFSSGASALVALAGVNSTPSPPVGPADAVPESDGSLPQTEEISVPEMESKEEAVEEPPTPVEEKGLIENGPVEGELFCDSMHLVSSAVNVKFCGIEHNLMTNIIFS